MASSGSNTAQQGLLLVAVAASLLAVTQAATVVVGGTDHWRYGYNYTEWAANTAPFYFEDTLVFKYKNTQAHSVYLLPNLGESAISVKQSFWVIQVKGKVVASHLS
ncbi:uncharacterized protein LOC120194522 [Hibiscus syriacus]|uniref:uncharacterized protein LOC120194522 n=1 Tax=Hibiscus syriacus TaxID=106335 RepID=UPI001923A747|nr:uncharacterized protein LOC120194522 [Hibiscus syriacus]